jgi:hypothetical protein
MVEEAEQAIRKGRKLLSIVVDEVQLPPRLLLQGWDGSRTNAIAKGLPAFCQSVGALYRGDGSMLRGVSSRADIRRSRT